MWKYALLLVMALAFVQGKYYPANVQIVSVTKPFEVEEISFNKSGNGGIIRWNVNVHKGKPPARAVLTYRHKSFKGTKKVVVDDICRSQKPNTYENTVKMMALYTFGGTMRCPIPKGKIVRIPQKPFFFGISVRNKLKNGTYYAQMDLQFPFLGFAHVTALRMNYICTIY